MDTGLTIKPTSSPTQIGVGRDDALPVPKAAPTELAPSQTVTAAAPSTNTQAQPGSPSRQGTEAEMATLYANAFDYLDGRVLLDAQSCEVVFRMIDVRTRKVVEQVPDQALLRLRAYTRAIASGEALSAVAARSNLAA
ncbi:hypothetical protein [Blastochloris sulfoviridis]|uniref:hypothetical protein n=1 Tax=Blastochloris sulfoviridis TaxID=50712 RepID=UPI001478703B|nr:hypothetical protein [Blastochloris sulfoviridis]